MWSRSVKGGFEASAASYVWLLGTGRRVVTTDDAPPTSRLTEARHVDDHALNEEPAYQDDLSFERHRRPATARAWDAPELTHQDELSRGDELRLETAQHADGGGPARARAQLVGWE